MKHDENHAKVSITKILYNSQKGRKISTLVSNTWVKFPGYWNSNYLSHRNIKRSLCLPKTWGDVDIVDIALEALAENHSVEGSIEDNSNSHQILFALNLKVLYLSHIGWLGSGPWVWRGGWLTHSWKIKSHLIFETNNDPYNCWLIIQILFFIRVYKLISTARCS